MAQIQTLLSEQSGSNSNLPENNQISSSSSKGKLSAGTKVAINAGLQISRQYIQKAASQFGGLYGNTILQSNIGEATKLASYGAQIATTGWIGAIMVGADITYNAIVSNIKDTQARRAAAYQRDAVGFISTGAGKYDE